MPAKKKSDLGLIAEDEPRYIFDDDAEDTARDEYEERLIDVLEELTALRQMAAGSDFKPTDKPAGERDIINIMAEILEVKSLVLELHGQMRSLKTQELHDMIQHEVAAQTAIIREELDTVEEKENIDAAEIEALREQVKTGFDEIRMDILLQKSDTDNTIIVGNNMTRRETREAVAENKKEIEESKTVIKAEITENKAQTEQKLNFFGATLMSWKKDDGESAQEAAAAEEVKDKKKGKKK